MGALIYRPAIDDTNFDKYQTELDSIAAATEKIQAGTITDVIEELYALGGSSGGARPKIQIGYNPSTNHLIHGTDNLPSGYEHWLIKFPSSSDRKDIANIEFAYYKMAIASSIEMNESRLFEGKSEQMYFGTKRFDRNGDQRLHLHSASGMMRDNFRLSNIDYGNIMDCAFRLEKHVDAYAEVLQLAAFNIFAQNRDDHSKNFSFLMDETGKWKFAPAYDLTFSNSSHGMHSTMVAGESKNPSEKELLKLANYFHMKNPDEILERVRKVVTNWKNFANESGVSKESIDLINKVIAIKT